MHASALLVTKMFQGELQLFVDGLGSSEMIPFNFYSSANIASYFLEHLNIDI